MLSKQELAEKVALFYYEENNNQREIAQRLNISRSYVSQLLIYARENNIVDITINLSPNGERQLRREIEFEKMFPELRQAYILSGNANSENASIYKFAGRVLTDLISESSSIGLNLGRSVEKALRHLVVNEIEDPANKKVVQVMGGLNNNLRSGSLSSSELVLSLGRRLGCKSYVLNCPVIIENKEVRSALLEESSISEVIGQWESLDLLIMSLGTILHHSMLFSQISEEMRNRLICSNIVCEATVNFLDREGKYYPIFEESKIAIPYHTMKRIPNKVSICADDYKAASICAAVRGGLVDILIIDSATADAIEEYLNI
jgi:deoxyribonucleoside regulator